MQRNPQQEDQPHFQHCLWHTGIHPSSSGSPLGVASPHQHFLLQNTCGPLSVTGWIWLLRKPSPGSRTVMTSASWTFSWRWTTSSTEWRRPWDSLFPYKSRRNCSCCRSCSSLSLLSDGDNHWSKEEKTACSQYKPPNLMLQSQHHGGWFIQFFCNVWFTLSQHFRSSLTRAVLQSTLYTLKNKSFFHVC